MYDETAIGTPSSRYLHPPATTVKPSYVDTDAIVGPPLSGEAPPMPGLPTFLREPEEASKGNPVKKPAKGIPVRHAIMGKPPPTGIPVANILPPPGDLEAIDDPRIGGSVTLCVWLHGDNPDLHRRCLNSILETVPPARRYLHIVASRLGKASLQFVEKSDKDQLTLDQTGMPKYAAMRVAFNDNRYPIQTPWVIWFDAVAYAKHHQWLKILTETIVNQNVSERVGMLGRKYRYTLSPAGSTDPRRWFEQASWYKPLQWRNKFEAPAPNGDQIHYVRTDFFAVSTQAIQACRLPDNRLTEAGGDIAMGEQLYRGGFLAKQFDGDCRFIALGEQPVLPPVRFPWQ